MRRSGRVAFIVAALLMALPMAARATERLFAVTESNKLLIFTSADTQNVQTINITGLEPSETAVGISRRPANGEFYVVGSTSRLYRLNTSTGAVTQVGSDAFNPALAGNLFGIDFNPVTDRLRVVSNTSQNLRLNPDTGTVDATDTDLAFATGDANAGSTPAVTSIAYTNSNAGATETTLYGIDTTKDVLVTIGSVNGTPTSPNTGQLFTVGSLGVDATGASAFDISPVNNVTYAILRDAAGTSKLYRIDLGNGDTTELTTLAGNETFVGLTTETITPGTDGGTGGADGGTGNNNNDNDSCQSAGSSSLAFVLMLAMLGGRLLLPRSRRLRS